MGFLNVPDADTARIGSLLRGYTNPEYNYNGLWYYDGKMDNVQLYSATLTPTEVENLLGQGALARNPGPANNASYVWASTTCSWAPGFEIDSQVFKLYSDPNTTPIQQTSISAGTTKVDPLGGTELNLDTTYYWRVDSIQSSWTVQGTLWKFTTGSQVAGDLNGDGIVNFEDFALMAGHWLE